MFNKRCTHDMVVYDSCWLLNERSHLQETLRILRMSKYHYQTSRAIEMWFTFSQVPLAWDRLHTCNSTHIIAYSIALAPWEHQTHAFHAVCYSGTLDHSPCEPILPMVLAPISNNFKACKLEISHQHHLVGITRPRWKLSLFGCRPPAGCRQSVMGIGCSWWPLTSNYHLGLSHYSSSLDFVGSEKVGSQNYYLHRGPRQNKAQTNK